MPVRYSGVLILLATVAIAGCSALDIKPWLDRSKAQAESRKQNVRDILKSDDSRSRLIGNYIKIADSTLGLIKVQGVGVVDRLDGTGDDPPASPLRTALLEDLRRLEIVDPQTYLRSSSTTLVVVTAYIPPIVQKDDKIDVEVTLPDGSNATSLSGGWLMPCHLREHALMGGQVREGREVAIATGPVLIDALNNKTLIDASGHRRGRIPAGAIFTGTERKLTIRIASDYRTVRMSSQIAGSIGKRFYDYDNYGIQRPMAEAQDDSEIELIVHQRYRDNYQRYLQVIRHIMLTESTIQRHIRMQELLERIQFGPTSEQAALELEAIGQEAIPTLKVGLTSDSLEARFRSAEALAYLGNEDGVPALAEAAAREPAFRIFALAALSTVNNGASAQALLELMSHESTETRYGAFRAFSTMSPNDPNVVGLDMDGEFTLHQVESTGSPLVHLTRHKKAEIVVFGKDQELLMPLALRAGSRIVIRGTPQSNKISVKRVAVGEDVQELLVSARVVDVIRAASELGATYPDVVQMLVDAKRQHNLSGEIAIDELPAPGRYYSRKSDTVSTAELAEADEAKPVNAEDANAEESDADQSVQVGNSQLTPEIFSGGSPAEEDSIE